MEYSKQFEYKGITVLFDKFITDKQYPMFYIPIKNNKQLPVFIRKHKLKCTGILKVTEAYSVANFTFNE